MLNYNHNSTYKAYCRIREAKERRLISAGRDSVYRLLVQAESDLIADWKRRNRDSYHGTPAVEPIFDY